MCMCVKCVCVEYSLFKRLLPISEKNLPESQCSFHPTLSTTDMNSYQKIARHKNHYAWPSLTKALDNPLEVWMSVKS